MKKKISRIWGIGLVIVLAASLLLSAAPVSAGTLSWGSEDLPDELAVGDVTDLAVAADGATIYATTGSKLLNGTLAINGGSWNTHPDYPGAMTGSINGVFTRVAPGDPLGDFTGIAYVTFNTVIEATLEINGTITDTEMTFSGTVEITNDVSQVDPEIVDITAGTIDFATGVIQTMSLTGTGDTGPVIILLQPVLVSGQVGAIYRSTNDGESWSSLSNPTDADVPQLVAVAPDNHNYIAIVADDKYVHISDDGGANWDSLGAVEDLITPSALATAKDLAISVEKGGNHFVAVAGTNSIGPPAGVFYYEIGAIGSDWEDATDDDGVFAGVTSVAAVAFSPNFYSDQVMVAVTHDATPTGAIYFETYSFDSNSWNAGAFPSATDLVQSSETIDSLDSASIAMAPDYLGSDDSMRIAFVGLAVNGSGVGNDMESEGIFRLNDDDVEVLKDEEAIHSIAFDGSLLVAGHFEEITIYRSTDAMADDPSVSGSTGTKEPGGENKVLVGIAGSDVVVGTSGDESAFAYSEDNGKSFNDLSLIDTDLATLCDVAVTPDGSLVYLVTRDTSGDDLSVWMLDDRWERIYSSQDVESDYIIRLAPDDSDVIYLAEKLGTSVYFSSSGGVDKWHTRIYKEDTIFDLAVETDGDTIYVLTDSGYVSKSTNRGFTWGSKKASKLDSSSMILSLGDDMVVAGSQNGRVSYSTDGNVTWTKLDNEDFGDTDPVQVTATGLADGDFVIAASGAGVYSWELGEADSWDDISPSDFSSGNVTSGIGIMQGVLYVIADGGSDPPASILARTLTPTSDSPTWSTKVIAEATFNVTPTALRMSVSGDVTKLWAIDSTANQLFSYKDTLATAPVASRAPADGSDILFNTVSGDASQIVFSWTCPSDKVTEFDFEIATDTDFDETVLSEGKADAGGWDEGDVISIIVGPGAGETFGISFMPDTTYYWKVRVNAAGPVRSAWSETRSFTLGSLPEILPPVVIQQPPAPVLEVPPAPSITLQPPEIVLPAPPPAPPEIVIPAAPEPTPPVPSWAIYAIIIIGAVLVIALIVLIMRTRRPV